MSRKDRDAIQAAVEAAKAKREPTPEVIAQLEKMVATFDRVMVASKFATDA
jgi:hypothetical protein